MRKTTTAALLALATALAACSDSSVAPKRQAAQVQNVQGGGASAALTGWDTLRFSFVIDPSRTISYPIGAGNNITFPAGSLCDPWRSTYGDGEWDKPCTVATAPVTINAKAWLDAAGHPRIDFTPGVRFVPTLNPLQWVTLSFTDYYAAYNLLSSINYCKTTSSGCVDESVIDPTLATIKDPTSGRLTRRVKHFSGYNVAAGFTSMDPTSAMSIRPTGHVSNELDAETSSRARSGFMLASGRR